MGEIISCCLTAILNIVSHEYVQNEVLEIYFSKTIINELINFCFMIILIYHSQVNDITK